jgi:hypothetical protein
VSTLSSSQGDQMFLWKNRPMTTKMPQTVAQPIFFFKKFRQIGNILPNLATLTFVESFSS